MGNSAGKQAQRAAQFGQIFLQTDKSTYFGGETVTGRVCLNLLLPYPGNQLYIKLKGKEAVHMVIQRTESYQENGQQKTRHIEDLFEEKDNIIKMTVPLYSWGTLMPGQYVIPFAFMLPANLPSSFHQEGHRYVANVTYRLESILEPSIKSEPRLKFKQEFVVRQPLSSTISNVGHEINTNITTCCCMAQGSNILKTNFEKNFYAPGETAQVVMQLNNSNSKVNNTRIAFCLKQRLTLTAAGRTQVKNFTKVERDLPGIPAGSQSSNNLIALNLPIFQGGDYQKVKTWSMTQHLINLKEIPNVLNCATKSKLINSEYFLEVSCPMEGCCASTPVTSCPIGIYYPEIKLQQVQVPANWAPVQFDSVNVAFGGGMPVMPQITMKVDMGGMNMGMNNNMNNGMTMNTNMNTGMNMNMNTNMNNNGMAMNTGMNGMGMNMNVNTTGNQDMMMNNGQQNVNMNVNMGDMMMMGGGMNMQVTVQGDANMVSNEFNQQQQYGNNHFQNY